MLAQRMLNSEKNAQSQAVRVRLGELLRAYYEGMQHAPPADRLAELMEYLSERLELEAENNKAK
jgi:hypothetical protein